MALLATPNWTPHSEADKETVFRQLERLFGHPTFKSSRRCPAFLQYIVEHQLKGETQQLKERVIGAEVFGREADYDTSSDPVVRTTASEVRKRIAQYYQEPGHEGELRIELPLGSYLVEFHLPPPDGHAHQATAVASSEQRVSPPASARSATKKRLTPLIATSVLLIAVVASLVSWKGLARQPSSIDVFWQPMLKSQSPTLVCLNTWDISPLLRDSKSPMASGLTQAGIDLSQWLPIDDAVAFSQVTGFLGTTRTTYRMQGARSTTLSDLMQGPSVLIGVFGNPWTQRVTDPLRFHFVRGAQGPGAAVYIADQKDPSKRYAVEEGGSGAGSKDYAIVGRIFNAATGQVSFVMAGLNAAGTTAASEFVTTPRYMSYLETVLPDISSSKNIEAIIAVQVIDGRPGAPHVEAADSW